MKKGIYLLLALLVAVVAAVTTSWCYHRFYEPQSDWVQQDSIESVAIDSAIAQMSNPVFHSADDVLQFYERGVEQKFIDSIFYNIPIQTIEQVAQVVTSRIRDGATEKEIVIEYLRNYHDIYQYLKADDTPPDEPVNMQIQELKALSVDTIVKNKNDTVAK